MKKIDFQDAIMSLLLTRNPAKTICPSEVLPQELKKDKELMEQVRQSAKLLAIARKIEITQSGAVVDPNSFKGPIRLRLKSI